MKELLELTALFRRTKFRNSKLLEVVLDPDTQLGRICGALFRQEITSDYDLQELFPDLAKDKNKQYTLKSKLKERLLDLLFLLDFKEAAFTDRQQAFHECTKRMAASQMLMGRGLRQIGISELELLLRHTKRFEFTELALDALRTLRLHYGLMEGDERKFEAAERELEVLSRVWDLERKAESYYTSVMVGYVHKKADKKATSQYAGQLLEELKPHLEEVRSFKFQLFTRLLHLAILEGESDYQGISDLCFDALSFFEGKPYKSGLSVQVFHYNLLLSCLNLRSFDRAHEMVYRYGTLYQEGTFNWYKIQELYFLIALHSRSYQKAYDIWLSVHTQPNLSVQPDVVTEMWMVFGAYVQLLIKSGNITLEFEEDAEARFRMGKFLNSMVVFSKDKRGMNIPVMVVHFLYRLAEGKSDQLLDLAESMERYRKRYLDHPDTRRSNIFFQMLLTLPRAAWQRDTAIALTAGLAKELSRTTTEQANHNNEVEIIPYDNLWKIALDLLV